MPWCVPGRAFVLGTALNMLHPVTLMPSGLCDHVRPRTFVTRGWGFAASPMASGFYSLYNGMPTCSAIICFVQVLHQPRCVLHCEVDAL